MIDIPDYIDYIESTAEAMSPRFGSEQGMPVLLLLHCFGKINKIRQKTFPLGLSLRVGRGGGYLNISESWLSAPHFELSCDAKDCFIEDLDSKNGTYVNGLPLLGKQTIRDGSLIRAGRCLFVFHEGSRDVEAGLPREAYGMAGQFHVRPLFRRLRKLARSSSHVVVTGPSGAGKELAARAFAGLAERELVLHNAARFGSEDEAAATLFGVEKGVYTGVDKRQGLIAQADGKILFLDEAHNYPRRIQKALLRTMEEQTVTPIGGSATKPVDVRYVLATNEPAPDYGLAHDLLARMRVVEISPLKKRTADIPYIFETLAEKALGRVGIPASDAADLFTADHYESLCLDGFPRDNTRGLIKVAEEVAEEIEDGLDPEEAVNRISRARYGENLVAVREYARPAPKEPGEPSEAELLAPRLKKAKIDEDTLILIKEAYTACDGQVQAMTEHLKTRNRLRFSRRRLSKILDIMEMPRMTRKRT